MHIGPSFCLKSSCCIFLLPSADSIHIFNEKPTQMLMSRFSTSTLDHRFILKNVQDVINLSDTPTLLRRKEMLKKHPLPVHWRQPSTTLRFGRLRQLIFQILCMCAYGEPNLEYLWACIKLAEEGDEAFWVEEQKRMSEQQNNMLVLVRLCHNELRNKMSS